MPAERCGWASQGSVMRVLPANMPQKMVCGGVAARGAEPQPAGVCVGVRAWCFRALVAGFLIRWPRHHDTS